MITNSRQYKITSGWVKKFTSAIDQLRLQAGDNEILRKAEIDGLLYKRLDLQCQIQEYDLMKNGTVKNVVVYSPDEIGAALIKARIISGLTQKQLAIKLGLKEQQVQRYEATEYTSAALHFISEVFNIIGKGVIKML